MSKTITEIVAESPVLVEVMRTAANAVRVAVDEGVIATDAPRELKLAALAMAFHTIALDTIEHAIDPDEAAALVQAFGRLAYAEAEQARA